MLNWNLHWFQLLDSISWVRCASGNVSQLGGKILLSHQYTNGIQKGKEILLYMNKKYNWKATNSFSLFCCHLLFNHRNERLCALSS